MPLCQGSQELQHTNASVAPAPPLTPGPDGRRACSPWSRTPSRLNWIPSEGTGPRRYRDMHVARLAISRSGARADRAVRHQTARARLNWMFGLTEGPTDGCPSYLVPHMPWARPTQGGSRPQASSGPNLDSRWKIRLLTTTETEGGSLACGGRWGRWPGECLHPRIGSPGGVGLPFEEGVAVSREREGLATRQSNWLATARRQLDRVSQDRRTFRTC